MTEKLTHPLRTVERVKDTGKDAKEITPHAFWMTREYELHLECDHTQIRTSCNFHDKELGDLFPTRVRCQQCPGFKSTAPTRRKPDPTYDVLAAGMSSALLHMDLPGNEQDAVLQWVNTHGHYISDDRKRAEVHAAVVLAAFDAMLDGGEVRHSAAMREAIVAWSKDPGDGTMEKLRKASRRVYRSQHHRETTR